MKIKKENKVYCFKILEDLKNNITKYEIDGSYAQIYALRYNDIEVIVHKESYRFGVDPYTRYKINFDGLELECSDSYAEKWYSFMKDTYEAQEKQALEDEELDANNKLNAKLKENFPQLEEDFRVATFVTNPECNWRIVTKRGKPLRPTLQRKPKYSAVWEDYFTATAKEVFLKLGQKITIDSIIQPVSNTKGESK